MKCPECGQWNRASMPHCIKCGAPLNIDEVSKLQWKDTLKDSVPSTAYLRADEFGQMDATPDARDQLAREMQDLKKRKQEGAEKQSRMRGNADRRPSSEVVVTKEDDFDCVCVFDLCRCDYLRNNNFKFCTVP